MDETSSKTPRASAARLLLMVVGVTLAAKLLWGAIALLGILLLLSHRAFDTLALPWLMLLMVSPLLALVLIPVWLRRQAGWRLQILLALLSAAVLAAPVPPGIPSLLGERAIRGELLAGIGQVVEPAFGFLLGDCARSGLWRCGSGSSCVQVRSGGYRCVDITLGQTKTLDGRSLGSPRCDYGKSCPEGLTCARVCQAPNRWIDVPCTASCVPPEIASQLQ